MASIITDLEPPMVTKFRPLTAEEIDSAGGARVPTHAVPAIGIPAIGIAVGIQIGIAIAIGGLPSVSSPGTGSRP
jgi:hypothetical protein